jgi:acetyl esterase/lipase
VESSTVLPTGAIKELWSSTLKNTQGLSDPPVVTPGRVEDLSNLPPAYLDVGSAEVFRDETVAYATKLWASGVQAELHVWAGGFHGFDIFLPDTAVSQAARKTKV